ncbi:MAG: YqeG family HAD IIIA-type phosphatase [Tenericutes bacterium]|nr:YqeG family HAD IIIA-type phosphatase [Mycoplasmatota bacterium]
MSLFRPDMYKKNIFEIDYKKLKKDGIKCLIFDLDNTLGLIEHEKCPEETRKLIKELEKDFLIFISSNNTQQRIDPYLEDLGIKGVAWSLKPSTRSLRKIRKNEKLKKDEMVMIGDQIVTDILAGKRYKIKTILVDPLGKKDLKITGLNRLIENKIVKYYEKRDLFERGKYYG